MSARLNRYRSDASSSDQVTAIIALIRRFVNSKTLVHFPANNSIKEPFPSKDVKGVSEPGKVASISGTPTLENLTSFFSKPVAKPEAGKSTGSTSNRSTNRDADDHDNDANIDTEDRLTKGRGRDDRW